MDQTFPKSERLTGKKSIQELFTKSSSVFLFPFKILYTFPETSTEKYPRVLISVPKRRFSKAVHRNKLKRRIREAYRLHKSAIFTSDTNPDRLAIIYVGKEISDFHFLEKKLTAVLQKIGKK
ncbi:ribonuclease P protein component [Rapidithrix thailandica]|uniref:Ribonuclease P protein component n=1 Tax=Rapidithrix thailandica TaxID=413964 RepID=A0AAW9RVS3_9BACT